MKNKSILLLSLILIIFVFTITVISSNSFVKHLTLKEAYELALKKATEWDIGAQLYSLTSVDSVDNIIEDLNGKRRYWNFQFSVIDSNKHLIITIHDGKIENFVPTKGPNIQEKLIDSSDIKFDSTDMLERAKTKFQLSPGKNWAKGYHFTLNKIDNQPIMEVVGLDNNGYFTRLSYDSFTGDLISAIHKVPSCGGLFTSDFEFPLGEDKPINLLGASLSPNFTNDNLLIVWGVVNPYTPTDMPIAKIINTNELNWMDLLIDSPIIKMWLSNTFDIDNVIYVVTDDSVLKTTSLGESWEKTYDINSNILAIDYFDNKIAVLTDEGLLMTQDGGNTWDKTKVPQDTHHVGIDSSNLIIATEKELFKMGPFEWDKLEHSFSNNIRGLKVSDNNIVCYTDKTINIINQINNKSQSISYKGFIENVYLDFDFKINNQIFILSNENLLTRVGGDSDVIISSEVNRSKDGNLVDFLSGPNGKKYFIVSSKTIWTEFEKGEM